MGPPADAVKIARAPLTQIKKSVEAFRPFYENRNAVLIRDAVTHWPAISGDNDRKWTPTNLKRRLKDRVVPVEVGFNFITDKDYRTDVGVPMDSFMDFLIKHEEIRLTEPEKNKGVRPVCLAQRDIFEREAVELADDFSPPEHAQFGRLYLKNAWFGCAGTITAVHRDPYQNFHCQIYGRKRFLLWRWEDFEKLAPFKHDNKRYNWGAADPILPDETVAPEFGSLECWETILEPGDVLYVPFYWPHWVETLETAMAINFYLEPQRADHDAILRKPLTDPATITNEEYDRRYSYLEPGSNDFNVF